MSQKVPLNLIEFKDRGIFISASPQHGKTNLAKLISDIILKEGFIIRVFDSSQKWLNSNIPYYIQWREQNLKSKSKYPFDLSCVFDISRLTIESQKELVRRVASIDFSVLSETDLKNRWICYILEEAQLYLPSGSLTASINQEILRMVSVGHNFNQTNEILTQRPADVSVKAIGRCGQLYIGKHFEENDIRKLSSYLHWKPQSTYEKLTELRKGQFYYLLLGQKPVKINTPLHKQTLKPIQLFP